MFFQPSKTLCVYHNAKSFHLIKDKNGNYSLLELALWAETGSDICDMKGFLGFSGHQANTLQLFCTFVVDQDGDKKLTLSEFISLPVGTVENQQAQDIDDDWVKDRRKEFEGVIDANHDGIVTMEELEVSLPQLVSSSVFKSNSCFLNTGLKLL